MSFNFSEINKLNDDEYNLMMAKFKERMELYNGVTFGTTKIEDIKVNNMSVLDLNDADIMTIVDKTKRELDIYKTNVKHISKKIQNYEEILDGLNNFEKTVKTLDEQYTKLTNKATFINSEHKLPLTKHFGLDEESEKKFTLFLKEMEFSLEKQRELLATNLNKINRIKKFISHGMSQEKIKNMCSVCVTNIIDICINPCGHVFCNSCADKMNRCGMCRGRIITKIKIYLDEVDNDDNTNNTNDINTFSGFSNSFSNSFSNDFSFVDDLQNNSNTITPDTPV